jgi:hypothetical protein
MGPAPMPAMSQQRPELADSDEMQAHMHAALGRASGDAEAPQG